MERMESVVRDSFSGKLTMKRDVNLVERMAPEGGLMPGELNKEQRLHCGCSGTRRGMV